MRALKINAFPCGVGGEKHLHDGIVKEGFLRFSALLTSHSAMNHYHAFASTEERRNPILQVVERVAVLSGPSTMTIVLGRSCAGRPASRFWGGRLQTATELCGAIIQHFESFVSRQHD
jgi:hypothetical protein